MTCKVNVNHNRKRNEVIARYYVIIKTPTAVISNKSLPMPTYLLGLKDISPFLSLNCYYCSFYVLFFLLSNRAIRNRSVSCFERSYHILSKYILTCLLTERKKQQTTRWRHMVLHLIYSSTYLTTTLTDSSLIQGTTFSTA